jgi:hypothetical protein
MLPNASRIPIHPVVLSFHLCDAGKTPKTHRIEEELTARRLIARKDGKQIQMVMKVMMMMTKKKRRMRMTAFWIQTFWNQTREVAECGWILHAW